MTDQITTKDTLAGPGGLLGVPGMGRARRWGNRRKDKACTCGVNIATKEQIAPGVTRIRGNLCNVHGRYGPCDAGAAAKKPKKAGAGKGRKPAKPKKAGIGRGRKPAKSKKIPLTPEQRAAARDEQQAENRGKVLAKLGIAADGEDALMALRNGQSADPGAIARGGFEKAGLVEQAADGSYRLTGSGRATLGAADQGDQGRAGDTISGARDRTGARATRQTAAAERKRATDERRKQAAAERAKKQVAQRGKKQPSSGGGKQSTDTSAKRETERQQQRATRQTEHEADRTQRQSEHEQDRAARAAERDQAQASRDNASLLQAGLPPSQRQTQAPRVSSRRPKVQAPKRRGGNAVARLKSFSVFKSHDGAYRWIARSTTAYRDRDGEIITEKALDADAARMTATGHYGPLRYWHIGQPDPFDAVAPWGAGVDIGDCDYSTVIGRTSIESGTFKDGAIGKAFAESADDYELSPGFFHPPSQPDTAGEYHDIRRFERSVVPTKYGRASNLFTGMTVKEYQMDQTTYEARKQAFKADMRAKNMPSEFIDLALAGMEQADKSADDQRVAFKSDDAPVVYELADGTQGIIQDNRFITLKAAAPPDDTFPPVEDDKADDPIVDETDVVAEEPAGDYLGDMTPDAFFAQLDAHLAPLLKMQDMHKAMADGMSELKSLMGGTTTKDAGVTAEIATLKARLAELEGSKPAVINPDDVEAALKGAPQSPPDPNAPQIPNDPNRPFAAVAARTFPQLYQPTPEGGWAGWAPQGTLPQS